MRRTLKCLLPSILCIVLLTVVVSVAAVFVLPKVVEAINKGVETAAAIPTRLINQGVDTARQITGEVINQGVNAARQITGEVINQGVNTARQFIYNGQAFVNQAARSLGFA